MREGREIKMVRGRLCFIGKGKVSWVSVLDTKGKYVGTRYLTDKITDRRIDSAVLSVLQTQATY